MNRNLGFFTTGYDYMIQIIPVLIVAPLFIRGETEFGTIAQSTMAFAHLLGAFSLVVKQFPQLSTYAAVLARLSALAGATEATAARSESKIAIVDDPSRLAFDHLTLVSPTDGQTIVRDLSVEIPAAARTLIRTPGEAETEALQRAVAGIWEGGEGGILRPPIEHVLLVPDRPYLPPGTLRALLGKADGSAVPDDELREAIRIVGMDGPVQRMGGIDVERNWDDALSLEEQRLLSMARILVARPRYAMLAQLDARLGAERATSLMDALVQRGVGCVLVGGSELGRDAFELVVDIAPDGSWTKKRDKKEPT